MKMLFYSFLPPASEVWGKVMFSKASVILSRGSLHPVGSASSGSTSWGFPSRGRGIGQTPLIRHYRIWSMSGQHASYWNAFLGILITRRHFSWMPTCWQFTVQSEHVWTCIGDGEVPAWWRARTRGSGPGTGGGVPTWPVTKLCCRAVFININKFYQFY